MLTKEHVEVRSVIQCDQIGIFEWSWQQNFQQKQPKCLAPFGAFLKNITFYLSKNCCGYFWANIWHKYWLPFIHTSVHTAAIDSIGLMSLITKRYQLGHNEPSICQKWRDLVVAVYQMPFAWAKDSFKFLIVRQISVVSFERGVALSRNGTEQKFRSAQVMLVVSRQPQP